MHHFNMAHIEACRREQQQPPIGTPPPILQKESNHSSSAEGQPAAAKAVTVTRIVQVTQNNNIPLAEAGPQRSYTEAVKEGKRQAATYTSKSKANTGQANLPNPIPDGQEVNASILNSLPLPHYDDDMERQQAYGNTLNTPTYSPVTPTTEAEGSQPGTPAQSSMVKSCHGTWQVVDERDTRQQNGHQQNGDFHPAYHLAILESQNGQFSMKDDA